MLASREISLRISRAKREEATPNLPGWPWPRRPPPQPDVIHHLCLHLPKSADWPPPTRRVYSVSTRDRSRRHFYSYLPLKVASPLFLTGGLVAALPADGNLPRHAGAPHRGPAGRRGLAGPSSAQVSDPPPPPLSDEWSRWGWPPTRYVNKCPGAPLTCSKTTGGSQFFFFVSRGAILSHLVAFSPFFFPPEVSQFLHLLLSSALK